MNNIIEIKNLKKQFKDIIAVNNISFNVKEGSLFAFLGVNGAGKSTTINILCGNILKDSGTVIINNKNIDSNINEIKPLIGVVYQDSALDKQLSVKDNLEIKAAMFGIYNNDFKKRLKEIDSLLNINDILNRPIQKLSGGQKRKIDIARAILNNPKLLILDEPTTGLDPKTRKIVWNTINTLRKKYKTTVFLTTHYMEEATDADEVVILDSGKIVAKGTPLELKNKYTGDFITFYNSKEEDLKILNLPYKNINGNFRVEVKSIENATKLILKHPALFKDYEITKGKMDDVFLAVTGKSLLKGAENEKI